MEQKSKYHKDIHQLIKESHIHKHGKKYYFAFLIIGLCFAAFYVFIGYNFIVPAMRINPNAALVISISLFASFAVGAFAILAGKNAIKIITHKKFERKKPDYLV